MAKSKQEPEKPVEHVEVPISVPVTKWTVFLASPTPVANNPMTVDADNESEARAKFNEANGIRGSDHPYTVTKA